MKWQLGCVALAFAACRSSEMPSSLPAGGGADAGGLSIAIPPAADAGAKGNPGRDVSGPVVAMAYTSAGALVVQTEAGLTSIAPDGTKSELALPPHASATLSGIVPDSIAVQVDEDVLLVNLTPVALILRAHGRPIGSPEIGMVETSTRGDHDLAVRLVSPGTRDVVRLKLQDGLDARVEEMEVTTSKRFAIVTVAAEVDGETVWHAFSYGLATGDRVAEVLPLNQMSLLPNATLSGDHEIGFRGGDIVEVDLASGATLRKAPFACKKKYDAPQRGNPILDESGTRLMTTCDDDGVLLDARTLRRVRTYKNVVPGCDNGYALPAHFREDGKQLIVEGCGGEAHLDLASGKYACADGEGVMGGPYEAMAPPPGPSGTGVPRWVAPKNVPPCRAEGAADDESMQLSKHWFIHSTDEHHATMSGGVDANAAPIRLDDVVGTPAVAPGEDSFASVEGTHVIVRALPGGKVLRDLPF